ncbi:hypothetical protein NUW54_g5687 [Trametes sanguinea]|uniref:Uncharacterized protein n=1 Tax=Trametes sanguinea TaxID=158606 RepID=A0ACC1PWH6_9APHY|nr:hypothetical protein NUW54_g5687 [Trametes sanguinea]
MHWLTWLHPLAPIDDRTRPVNRGRMHLHSRLTLPLLMPLVRKVFEFEELMHRHVTLDILALLIEDVSDQLSPPLHRPWRETRCLFFHVPPASAFGNLSNCSHFIRNAGARSHHDYDGISVHGHHASYLTCAWEARQPSANPSTGDLIRSS